VLSRHFAGLTPGASLGSPLKPLFRPVVAAATSGLKGSPPAAFAVVVLVVSLVLQFLCLYAIVGLTRGVLAGRLESAIERVIGHAPVVGLTAGLVLTALVQSSSAVTSMLVPLAAAGILQLEQVYAITLGANIGTTVTAILAALAAGPAGLTIALAHLLFNVTGVLIFFPFAPARKIPTLLARTLAELTMRSRWYAFAYVAVVFFLAARTCVLLWR
jgi:sodium-dependent phosphate cotransporter